MEMPTPCAVCTEVFELNEGRAGLTHATSKITICPSCHEIQTSKKERVDSIRTQIQNISQSDESMNSAKEQLEEIENNISLIEDEKMDAENELTALKYKGMEDEYWKLVDEYF